MGAIEQDLGGDVRGAATGADQLDRLMEIRVALRDPLGEGKRITRLHEDVEAPALYLAAFVLFPLESVNVSPSRVGSVSLGRTLPKSAVSITARPPGRGPRRLGFESGLALSAAARVSSSLAAR